MFIKEKSQSGVALIVLVLGIASVALWAISLDDNFLFSSIHWFSIFFAVPGFILGVVSFRRSKQKAWLILGVLLSIISLLAALFVAGLPDQLL